MQELVPPEAIFKSEQSQTTEVVIKLTIGPFFFEIKMAY